MKKLLLLLIFLSVSLSLMGNSQASMGGIKLKDFPASSPWKKSLNLNADRELGNIFILPAEPFDEDETTKVIERIDRLPLTLIKKLNDENIKIKLFTGKLTDNPTARHLEGIIPRGYKTEITWDEVPGIGGARTVLVKIGHSEKGNGHGSVNLELHELAHSIDRHVYNDLRHHKQFLAVWKKEKNKLFPGQDYFLSFPEEYFAEAFAMYYCGGEYKEKLRTYAPETYQFLSELK